MKKSFMGITALVTGASSGIGREFACELAREGADLILVARSGDKLKQLAGELQQQFKVWVLIFEADLTRKEDREGLFRFIETERSQVDLLVNNAGFGHHGPFEDHPPQGLEEMLRLNIEALTVLTRFFLPGMKARRKGGIINVASTAAFQPIPYLNVYAATKAFVLSFSEALWMECKKYGVRVFCVCPGNTRTAFHDVAGIDSKRRFFTAGAGDVARFALRKFLKGRRPSGIFGFWNKLMIHAERLVPRILVVFFTGLIYHPEKAKQ